MSVSVIAAIVAVLALPACRVMSEDEFRQQTASWCAWEHSSEPAQADDSWRIPIELGPDWIRVGRRGERQKWAGPSSANWLSELDTEIAKLEQIAEMRPSSTEPPPPISWSLTADPEHDASEVVELIQHLALAGMPEGELWLVNEDPPSPQPPNNLVDEIAARVAAAERPEAELGHIIWPLVVECPMIAEGFQNAVIVAPEARCEAVLEGIAKGIGQCRWKPGSADRLLAGLYVMIDPRRARVPVRIDWLEPALAELPPTWAELVATQFQAAPSWVGSFAHTPALIEAARAQGCKSPLGYRVPIVAARADNQACRVSCLAGDQQACTKVRGDDRLAYFQLACDRATSGWDCRSLIDELEGEALVAVAARIDALSGPACDEQAIAADCETLYWRYLLLFPNDRDPERAEHYAQRTCDLGGACFGERRPAP